MYFVLNRLDAARFCKLEFIINFGIPPSEKTQMAELIESGEGKKAIFKYFDTLDIMHLLKLHKYFFWADKKIHHVFFIEDKDHISEDLLFDFKHDENEGEFKRSEQLGAKKVGQHVTGAQKKVEVEEDDKRVIDINRNKKRVTKDDLIFGGKAKKTVDIMDDCDFPDLDGPSFPK
mmetsp:Transcript_9368/g.14241  ORF Transcript_9368/g.14241 Transcript_9368/m.14241 type:complete len:175 (-) Transcript_9368:543-1067(-)